MSDQTSRKGAIKVLLVGVIVVMVVAVAGLAAEYFVEGDYKPSTFLENKFEKKPKTFTECVEKEGLVIGEVCEYKDSKFTKVYTDSFLDDAVVYTSTLYPDFSFKYKDTWTLSQSQVGNGLTDIALTNGDEKISINFEYQSSQSSVLEYLVKDKVSVVNDDINKVDYDDYSEYFVQDNFSVLGDDLFDEDKCAEQAADCSDYDGYQLDKKSFVVKTTANQDFVEKDLVIWNDHALVTIKLEGSLLKGEVDQIIKSISGLMYEDPNPASIDCLDVTIAGDYEFNECFVYSKTQAKVMNLADTTTFGSLFVGGQNTEGSTQPWAIDSSNVYFNGMVVADAEVDAELFQALSAEYAKDTKHVFYQNNIIAGVVPADFQVLLDGYAKDATAIYYNGGVLSDVDYDSFSCEVVDDVTTCSDTNGGYIDGVLQEEDSQ